MSEPLPQSGSSRLLSLDVFRGFIMLAMASEGFGFPQMARQFPESPVWSFLGSQFRHVTWRGCGFWDLIQPAFMFMVGVSMAYSYATRAARGQSYARMFGHAVYRAVVLVLLGVFLYSNGRKQTNFVFKNVLAQIGLGYVFLFLLWDRPRWLQAIAAAVILFGYWLLFVLYPLPQPDFDFSTVGVPPDWPHFSGMAAHWDKNTNAAAAVDRWFLNLFPRPEPFVFDREGYPTLNFIPSLATMICGLMTGELLRSGRTNSRKLIVLVAGGLVLLVLGHAFDLAGICPLVKRIWTPSWTLYSTGWVLLMLAAFYGVIDMLGWRRWTWPLVVVGMNSIVIYCLSELLSPWIASTLQTHFGRHVFDRFGHEYAPIADSVFVLLVLWLICAWMHRQRIFVRI